MCVASHVIDSHKTFTMQKSLSISSHNRWLPRFFGLYVTQDERIEIKCDRCYNGLKQPNVFSVQVSTKRQFSPAHRMHAPEYKIGWSYPHLDGFILSRRAAQHRSINVALREREWALATNDDRDDWHDLTKKMCFYFIHFVFLLLLFHFASFLSHSHTYPIPVKTSSAL